MPTAPWLAAGLAWLACLWVALACAAVRRRYCAVLHLRGWSGADAARYLLRAGGVPDVEVVRDAAALRDAYQTRRKRLCLTPASFDGRDLAAFTIAAHETGHAVQQRRASGLLPWRDLAVAAADWVLPAALLLLAAGWTLERPELASAATGVFLAGLALEGVGLLAELDASRRAAGLLQGTGFLSSAEEAAGFKALLLAASLEGFARLATGFWTRWRGWRHPPRPGITV